MTETISYAGIVINIFSLIFIFGYWKGKVDRQLADIDKSLGDCKVCRDSVKRLETQMEPFWKFIETKIAGSLHSPHTPEYDALIDKFSGGELNTNELLRLSHMLNEDFHEADSKKETAKLISIQLVMLRVEYLINQMKVVKQCLLQ